LRGYLVADPSRDLVTAENQQITRDWWQQRRASFFCLASQEVVLEASRGDPEQVRRRLAVLTTLPRVAASADAQELWRVKDDLAREADYDIDCIFSELRAAEARQPGPLIHSPDELRRHLADEERQREDASTLALKEAPAPPNRKD
jgi:hypothetical protein